MNRPSTSDLLRKIDQVELEVTAEWPVDQSQQLRDVEETLARDREQQLPRPSWLRQIFRAVVLA